MDKKLGIASLTLAIISVILPIFTNVTISTPIAILGLMYGIGSKDECKGMAIGGIVVSSIVLSATIIYALGSLIILFI